MEQCESAAALLESVREQEVQFEQLTRALEEERRRVGLSATSPSTLGRPLPHTQVTPLHQNPPFPPIETILIPSSTFNAWIMWIKIIVSTKSPLHFPIDFSHSPSLLPGFLSTSNFACTRSSSVFVFLTYVRAHLQKCQFVPPDG